MLVMGAGVQIRRAQDPLSTHDLSERETAIGKLYFWLSRIPVLDGGIFPHPKQALSSYLTEKVNDVWNYAPELISPAARWSYRMGGDEAEGRSLAEMLALLGVVLDPTILHAGAKAALDSEMVSERCIDLAHSKRRYGALLQMSLLGPASAEGVYRRQAQPLEMTALAQAASDIAVAGPGFALPSSNSSQYLVVSESAAMTVRSARELLSAMADSGVRCAENQVGWCAARPTPSIMAPADHPVSAISSAVTRMLGTASSGYDVSGYPKTIRDIGTVVGYATTPDGDKELATDFAGAVCLELLRLAKEKWPKSGFGQAHRTRESNPAIRAMLSRHPDADSGTRSGDGSFFGGLMQHFIDAGVDVDEPACVRRRREDDCGDDLSLRDVLNETMPDGLADAYASTLRARMMADVIAAAEIDPISVVTTPAPESPRRPRIRV